MSRDERATALADFASLPPETYVRLPTVKALYGAPAATIWRWVKAGQIPEPKRFGTRFTAWNVGELRSALNALTAA